MPDNVKTYNVNTTLTCDLCEDSFRTGNGYCGRVIGGNYTKSNPMFFEYCASCREDVDFSAEFDVYTDIHPNIELFREITDEY